MFSLQAQNLTKKFNRHVVFENLSFEHQKGILGIAGANGSGKSTLLQCLAFLKRPNQGSVLWQNDGTPVNQQQLKSNLGFAAPYINLYAELSVWENLFFLIEAGGKSVDENHLHQLLEEVQIPHLKDQLFGSLSTGQQQRTKLAAALVRDPEVLMLDEPGSNLDKKGQELVTSIVQTEAKKGTLILLASNNPEEIELCDGVVNMGNSVTVR
jgi:ABC-type multidrug transport system ATPase subunit